MRRTPKSIYDGDRPALAPPNWIDRAVAAVSPVAGLRRLQARQALNLISYGVARDAGGRKGTMGNWIVRRQGEHDEQRQRETIADRAADLVSNDAHAASAIDGMAVNVVGTGLVPQSTPAAKLLGWDEDAARAVQQQAEASFAAWSRAESADAGGALPFWAQQYLSIFSLLVSGEYLHLPVIDDAPGRAYSLCLQSISPQRLCTPRDMAGDAALRDGIQLGPGGRPQTYWIANPPAGGYYSTLLTSREFRPVPARVGHWPGVLHGFVKRDNEQVRGVSVLAPAMKFFRDLSDYLDYELVAAIITASFPIFIETSDPYGTPPAGSLRADGRSETAPRLQEVQPGQIVYGQANQKPHVLKNERPSGTFNAFVERILRAVGASVGMPYEVIAKDFSKTNYSSARAALLEAWRVFAFYQRWLIDGFCQPVWEMVFEEGWLRGLIELPPGADFYRDRVAITRAMWIPPKRGHVDPLKEMNANVIGLRNNILTLASVAAEMGGDWETLLEQRGRERGAERELDIEPPSADARSDVQDVPEPPQPQAISVSVESAPVSVSVESPPAVVNVAAAEAPAVHVAAPEVHVEPAQVSVAAPVVNVAAAEAPKIELIVPPRRVTKRVMRDAAGEIASIVEVEE